MPARANTREWTARAMTEREWQTLVIGAATAHGWWHYHTHNSRHSAAGFPDLVLVRDTELVFAELKSERGKVSPEQTVVLALLEKTGTEVHIWRPSDEADVFARLARDRPVAS